MTEYLLKLVLCISFIVIRTIMVGYERKLLK